MEPSERYKIEIDSKKIVEEEMERKAEAEAKAKENKPVEHTEISEPTNTAERVGVSDSFKKAMDEYERFFDNYVKFMKEFQATDNTASLLGQYTEYMTQYVETMESFEQIENQELTDDELVYYLEVQSRITRKLLEVNA